MGDNWFYALRYYRWNTAMILTVGLLVMAIILAAVGTSIRSLAQWPPLLRFSYMALVVSIPGPLSILYLHRYLCYRAALIIARQQDPALRYVMGYHAVDEARDAGRLRYLFQHQHSGNYVMITMTDDWWVSEVSVDNAQEWLDGLRSSSEE